MAKDQGSFFVDQNTARCAAYPAEALFRSLAVMQPRLSMLDFDLVTDRNCLRKLLRFVSGQDPDKPFRIDIQMQGSVMFLCRWETDLKMVILGHQNFGFGHGFEKATTTFDKDLRDSSGHHRVVKYNLGGIRCLVRYEADACIGGKESDKGGFEKAQPDDKAKTNDEKPASDEADLLDALQSLTVAPTTKGTVRVMRSGRVVSPSDILEIKTRAAHRRLQRRDLDEFIMPQLWFAQTLNLVVGYHQQGRFGEVQKFLAMKPELDRWEKRHQPELKKLVGLVRRLSELARAAGRRGDGRRCVVVCQYEAGHSSARLSVYESVSEQFSAILPDDILDQYQWTKGEEKQVADTNAKDKTKGKEDDNDNDGEDEG